VGRCESDVSCVRFNDVRHVMTKTASSSYERDQSDISHPQTQVFYSALLSQFPPAYDYLRSNTLAPDIRRISFSFTTATVNMNRLAIAD
jgi:hypothetical protein